MVRCIFCQARRLFMRNSSTTISQLVRWPSLAQTITNGFLPILGRPAFRACAHPGHVVQRALFEPQERAGLADIQG